MLVPASTVRVEVRSTAEDRRQWTVDDVARLIEIKKNSYLFFTQGSIRS